MAAGQTVTLAAITATVAYAFIDPGTTPVNLTASTGLPITTGTPITLQMSKSRDLWAISATGTACVMT